MVGRNPRGKIQVDTKSIADSAGSSPLGTSVLVLVFFLLLTTSLVNLSGGDWDGIQITLGSVFYADALEGDILFYRLAWQPLTYQIIRMVYKLTGSVHLCMFLPAILGSTGMTILLAAMRKVSSRRLSAPVLVGIILLIPEFLFGSIYMNSTVFGFVFAALTLWLTCEDWIGGPGHKRSIVRDLGAGSCLALACLCRFDFVLMYPMCVFLMVRAGLSGSWRDSLVFVVGSAIVFTTGYLCGLFSPGALLSTFLGHDRAFGSGGILGRSLGERVLLSLIGVNLFVWIAVATGAVWKLWCTIRNRRWFDLLIVCPLVVLLYPIASIATPKYLVPFYMFVALLAARTLTEAAALRRWGPRALYCAVVPAVVLACLLPIRPSRAAESPVALTCATWRPTDDGPRSFWGYLFALRELQSRRDPDVTWLDSLLDAPNDIILAAPHDGWISGPRSQAYLLHLAKRCKPMEIEADHVLGEVRGKTILLSEPGTLQANSQKYFSQVQQPPQSASIPLGLGVEKMDILRHIAAGTTTEAGLAEEMHVSPQRVARILNSLEMQWGLIRRPGPDRYELRYPIDALVPDANISPHDEVDNAESRR
jgi:hypothetical protein